MTQATACVVSFPVKDMKDLCRHFLLPFVLLIFCSAPVRCDAGEQASTYGSDFAALVTQVELAYPFFDLKHIREDWAKSRPALIERAGQCTSDEQFIGVIYDAIRVLRDSHMSLSSQKIKLPDLQREYYPLISFIAVSNQRVAVFYAPPRLAEMLKTGTLVTQIDGIDAREYLENRSLASWKQGGFFSSPQRARMFEYRIPLRDQQNARHHITVRADGKEMSYTITCDTPAGGFPHTYNMPANLQRVGRSFQHGELGENVGYVYLRRVDPDAAASLDEALKAHPQVTAWVVDLRGNVGGGYDDPLLAVVKNMRQPIVVLIDAGCISAGETLARDFQKLANAKIFGSRSAGASSSKMEWAFPSGIASIRMSTRSRLRNDGQPIEFNGIEPDVIVEDDPDELLAGKNPCIERAKQYLIQSRGE